MKNIIGIIKASRLPSVIAMNLFVFLPIYLHLKDILYAVLQTIPFILMISGEIILNDCCDVDKDRINKPHRPLVHYNVNIKIAAKLAFFIILFSVLLSFLIYRTNIFRLALFLVVVALLTLYNHQNAIVPIIKTLVTALATVLSLLFAYSYSSLTSKEIFFLLAAFFYILGRELLMDIRDVKGDGNENYKTIAVILGSHKVFFIGCICFFIADLFLGLYISIDSSFNELLLCVLAIIVESMCIIKFYQNQTTKQQNRYALLLWVPILLILISQLF